MPISATCNGYTFYSSLILSYLNPQVYASPVDYSQQNERLRDATVYTASVEAHRLHKG
jgi:hypothetical protein